MAKPNDEDKALDDKVKERAAEIEKIREPESTEAEAAGAAEDDRDDPDARPEPREEPARPRDNRWRRMNEERDSALAEARQLREQMTQLLGVMQERTRAPEPKEPAEDPFAERLDKIKRERNLLYREIQAGAGKLTQEQLDNIERRAQALEEEHVETLAERLVTKRGLAQPQRQEHPLKPFLALQFPDVVQNPKAVDYARAHFQMELAKGRPESMELVIESHQRAREALRTAPTAARPDPNGATRRTGMGTGPGAGAAHETAVPSLTKEQRKMADVLYEHVPDPKKRYQKWSEGPGRRLAGKS